MQMVVGKVTRMQRRFYGQQQQIWAVLRFNLKTAEGQELTLFATTVLEATSLGLKFLNKALLAVTVEANPAILHIMDFVGKLHVFCIRNKFILTTIENSSASTCEIMAKQLWNSCVQCLCKSHT